MAHRSASDPARRHPRFPFPHCFAKERRVVAVSHVPRGLSCPHDRGRGNGLPRTTTGPLASSHREPWLPLRTAGLGPPRLAEDTSWSHEGQDWRELLLSSSSHPCCKALLGLVLSGGIPLRGSRGHSALGYAGRRHALTQRDDVRGAAPPPGSAHASHGPATGQTQGPDETTTQHEREDAPPSGKRGPEPRELIQGKGPGVRLSHCTSCRLPRKS